MTASNEHVDVKKINENVTTGIAMAIEQKVKEVEPMLSSLSKNALERVIKSVLRFPQALPTTSELEKEVVTALYAIHDLQVEMSILTIAKIQEEKNEAEQSRQEIQNN